MLRVEEVVAFFGDDRARDREHGGRCSRDPRVAECGEGPRRRCRTPIGRQLVGRTHFNQRLGEVAADQRETASRPFQVDQKLESRQRTTLCRVNDARADAVPPAAESARPFTVECGCCPSCLDDAVGGDLHLDDDALLDLIDEPFDGQGADFRAGQIKRCGAAEGALRSCQPLFRCFAIAFEQVDGPSEHA